MRLCDFRSGNGYGSVPMVVACLLTAVVVVATLVPMYLAPAFAGGMGLILPLFAGGLTIGVLRAQVPKQFRPVWALVGFPLMIGLTILSISVLRESSPPQGGSSGANFVWFVPFLFLNRSFRRTECSADCRGGKALMIGIWGVLLIPVIIAGWLVWDALQTGQGRVYAALPQLFEVAGIWTGTMLLVGVAMVSTMGLRKRPEDGDLATHAQ